MRHVLRTFRVDLEWLFERVRVDPGILMKYVNTKQQLADMLTKGSFTAAQWAHLRQLFSLGPRKESLKGASKGPEKAAAPAAPPVAPNWAPRPKSSRRSNTNSWLARNYSYHEHSQACRSICQRIPASSKEAPPVSGGMYVHIARRAKEEKETRREKVENLATVNPSSSQVSSSASRKGRSSQEKSVVCAKASSVWSAPLLASSSAASSSTTVQSSSVRASRKGSNDTNTRINMDEYVSGDYVRSEMDPKQEESDKIFEDERDARSAKRRCDEANRVMSNAGKNTEDVPPLVLERG